MDSVLVFLRPLDLRLACEETSKGSLEPGKLADMVVLGDNPLAVDKKAIRDIPVLATIVGNELVYGSLE